MIVVKLIQSLYKRLFDLMFVFVCLTQQYYICSSNVYILAKSYIITCSSYICQTMCIYISISICMSICIYIYICICIYIYTYNVFICLFDSASLPLQFLTRLPGVCSRGGGCPPDIKS